MHSAPHFCGLILAAGQSSRMGTDKALLPWPPQESGATDGSAQTLLAAAILALRPLTRAVIVVAGENAESLAPIVDANGAFLVRNPNPERGQFSSLQTGLRGLLNRGYNAAMITPVDCPPLRATSLKLLRECFERALASGLWAVAPENNGKHGHPLLVNCNLIDALLAAPVTGNAREVLRGNAQRIEYIAVPDTLVKAGLNTPHDYAALVKTPPSF